MTDKKFCGNGKSFGQYGGIRIGIRASELPPPNDKGWINLIVSPKKDGTYYVAWDDYNPKGAKSEEREESKRQGFQPNDKIDSDLPF